MKCILSCGDHFRLVDNTMISHIEACQNYTKVYLLDETMILCSMNMLAMLDCLGGTFLQVHKSYTVNLEKVIKYYKKGTIELENGARVPLARRRHKELMMRWKDIYP